MGVKLGEAVVYLLGDQEGIEGSLKDTERKTDAWAGKIAGGVTKVIGGAFKAVAVSAAAAGAAIGAVGIAAGKLAIDALPIQGVADAFAGITGNADEALAKLREGSLGMVRDADLMESYNSAMQLVGKEFADELPGAMQYLSKVSAATGEDMGYMIDSLVKGVGRLSPAILDNLGIQVQLSDATARASEMFGKEADELTKAEQQAGMMNVVMEKLAENTASMPEVAGTAAQQWAAFNTTLQNAKDTLGRDLIPLMAPLLQPLGALAERVLPLVGEAMRVVAGLANDHLVPAMTWLTETIDKVAEVITWTLEQGGDLEMVLRNVLSVLLEQLGLTEEQMDGVFEVINKVQDAFLAVTGFIEENAVPILAGLAAALLTIVVPAFVSWAGAAAAAATATVTALAPVVLPILAIGAAVALLVKAWERDWGGIRTALTAFWEETGKPIFETVKAWLEKKIPQAIAILKKFWEEVLLPALQLVWAFIEQRVFPTFAVAWQWLAEKIPAAVQTTADFWNETLKPALEAVWAFLKDSVFPIFTTAWEWLQEKLPAAVQTLSDFWNETLLPAITAVWAFIDEYIIPIFNALVDVYIAALNLALTALQGIWEKVLLPALEAVWKFIKEDIGPILEELAEGWLAGVQLAAETLATFWTETLKPALEAVWKFIRDNLGPILEWFRDEVVKRLTDALDGLKGALTWVKDRLNELKDALKNVKLPDWLTPGSPTPFEMGLRGIADAMAELNRVELPRLQTNLAMAGAAGGGLASAASVVNHTYEITNWSPEPESRLNLSNLISALELAHAS